MDQQTLLPHLFRTESRSITAVLCKLFGIGFIEAAEDIVWDTFLAAAELWGLKGLPANPRAWLYAVAKNKARNYLKHDRVFKQKVAKRLLQTPSDIQELPVEIDDTLVRDSQLQMMFAICWPGISTEAQVALSLRILCGFGIEEIASAFLTSKENITRRLYRAKEKLRAQKVAIALPPPSELQQRLDTVLHPL